MNVENEDLSLPEITIDMAAEIVSRGGSLFNLRIVCDEGSWLDVIAALTSKGTPSRRVWVTGCQFVPMDALVEGPVGR